jgi:hypothetical protein
MGRLDCTPDPIYSPNTYNLQAVAEQLPPALLDVAAAVAAQLPAGLRHWLAGLTVTMRPMELHAMVLAAFASFVAPFGELCELQQPQACVLYVRLSALGMCRWRSWLVDRGMHVGTMRVAAVLRQLLAVVTVRE